MHPLGCGRHPRALSPHPRGGGGHPDTPPPPPIPKSPRGAREGRSGAGAPQKGPQPREPPNSEPSRGGGKWLPAPPTPPQSFLGRGRRIRGLTDSGRLGPAAVTERREGDATGRGWRTRWFFGGGGMWHPTPQRQRVVAAGSVPGERRQPVKPVGELPRWRRRESFSRRPRDSRSGAGLTGTGREGRSRLLLSQFFPVSSPFFLFFLIFFNFFPSALAAPELGTEGFPGRIPAPCVTVPPSLAAGPGLFLLRGRTGGAFGPTPLPRRVQFGWGGGGAAPRVPPHPPAPPPPALTGDEIWG